MHAQPDQEQINSCMGLPPHFGDLPRTSVFSGLQKVGLLVTLLCQALPQLHPWAGQVVGEQRQKKETGAMGSTHSLRITATPNGKISPPSEFWLLPTPIPTAVATCHRVSLGLGCRRTKKRRRKKKKIGLLYHYWAFQVPFSMHQARLEVFSGSSLYLHPRAFFQVGQWIPDGKNPQ